MNLRKYILNGKTLYNKHYKLVVWLFLCIAIYANAQGQYIKGTVYDISQRIPLPDVTVMSTSGDVVHTDSIGEYRILAAVSDSIWFSYLGKSTPPYAASVLQKQESFDISIQIAAIDLPNIIIRAPNYRMDSLRNRQEYEKAFNYRKPRLATTMRDPNSDGFGVGLDINEIANMFRFRHNKNQQFLQRWLIKEEKEKYIDYKFNQRFVKQLTNLEGDDLDLFMRNYRPDYEFLTMVNEAELGLYILECFKQFQQMRPRKNQLR